MGKEGERRSEGRGIQKGEAWAEGGKVLYGSKAQDTAER